MSTELPISELQPSSLTATATIQGVITLIWPYSQSTQTCAILLAADDFRLRARRGQVRVNFSGTAAKAVAESHAGISDVLKLSLHGARWLESADIKTPGKSVEGEIGFKDVLDMSVVSTDGIEKKVSIRAQLDEHSLNGSRVAREQVTATPQKQVTHVLHDSPTSGHASRHTFDSPAFLRTTQSSINLTEGSTFDEDDIEAPRKRMRFSLGESRHWHYVRRTPSPVKSIGDIDDQSLASPSCTQTHVGAGKHQMQASGLTGEIDGHATMSRRSASSMQPPSLPQLRMPGNSIAVSASRHSSQEEAPSTPQLYPVPAAALPLPSPFPNESMESNFHSTSAAPLTSGSGQSQSQTIAASTNATSTADVTEAEPSSVRAINLTSLKQGQQKVQAGQPASASTDGVVPDSQTDGSVLIESQHPTQVSIATADQTDSRSHTAVPASDQGSQDPAKRSETSKQTLNRLFGFTPSVEHPQNQISSPVQRHGRNLSDFEIAESQAMVFADSKDDTTSTGIANLVASELTNTDHVGLSKSGQAASHESATLSNGSNTSLHLSAPTSQSQLVWPGNYDGGTAEPDRNMSEAWHMSKTSVPAYSGPPKEAASEPVSRKGKQVFEQTEARDPVVTNTAPPLTPALQPVQSVNLFDMQNTENNPDVSTRLVGSENVLTPQRAVRPRAVAPSALRKWINPKRQQHNTVNDGSADPGAASALVPDISPARLGLQTSHSYFTTIQGLRSYINATSQPSHPTNRVDVIAVLGSDTSQPQRQRSAPRDHFTVFEILDDTDPDEPLTEVRVYRPWAASLPVASLGDVILLRAFTVETRNHQACLKSNDESAWAVWRWDRLYGDEGEVAASGRENQPFGYSIPAEDDVTVEMNGPPVEYGEEEIVESRRLERWIRNYDPEEPPSEIYDNVNEPPPQPRSPPLVDPVRDVTGARPSIPDEDRERLPFTMGFERRY